MTDTTTRGIRMSDTTTRGIRVQVRSEFIPDRSSPRDGSYLFQYHVRISNEGPEVTQLISREWIITSADGEVEQRPVRPSSWLDALDLMDNEVDVTGLVRSTSFLTCYVVAPSFMGRPWVEKVPAGFSEADPTESRREVKTSSARSLVADLLAGYAPDERTEDKQWKRCFAAMMRQVHR